MKRPTRAAATAARCAMRPMSTCRPVRSRCNCTYCSKTRAGAPRSHSDAFRLLQRRERAEGLPLQHPLRPAPVLQHLLACRRSGGATCPPQRGLRVDQRGVPRRREPRGARRHSGDVRATDCTTTGGTCRKSPYLWKFRANSVRDPPADRAFTLPPLIRHYRPGQFAARPARAGRPQSGRSAWGGLESVRGNAWVVGEWRPFGRRVGWLGLLVACGGGGWCVESGDGRRQRRQRARGSVPGPATARRPSPDGGTAVSGRQRPAWWRPTPRRRPVPEPSSPFPRRSHRTQAARFLAQATFGPTEAGIAAPAGIGPTAWLDEQFSQPVVSHLAFVNSLAAGGTALTQVHFRQSFWAQAIAGEDQLRQRMAFALSQVFVVSFDRHDAVDEGAGMASYSRHAGRPRLRQLPGPAAGGGHTPDDGHLPQHVAQPEGGRGHRAQRRTRTSRESRCSLHAGACTN